ncbi:MAG: response regulator [Myxococcales bacterium]|nr:response regulator [Myxococcales bacterium]
MSEVSPTDGPFSTGSAGTAGSLVLVDDDERFRTRLARALRRRGFDVSEAGSVGEALALRGPFTHALVDLRMPGESGLELIEALKARDAGTTVVVLTGYGSIATALDAVRRGATHYLTKPVSVDAIVDAFAMQVPRGEALPGATRRVDPCAGGGRGAGGARLADEGSETPPSLARVEWEHIQRVLADCGGNISLAAKRLGLHRRTLQRKLAKYPPER